MNNLLDKRQDIIIIHPDDKTFTAIVAWKDKLNTEDKAKFVVDATERTIISYPDPLGVLDAKRDELIALVDVNAESETSIVRLQFNGPTFASISMMVGPLPEDDK